MQQIYEKGFSLRKPYQVLLDDTFLCLAQRHQVDLKRKLEQILGNEVRLMVSGCVMNALKVQSKAGEAAASSTHNMARSLELRRCRHEKEPKTVGECFKTLIGDDNPFHYCVATASEELKKTVRSVAGIPLLYFERVFPLLEAPTPLTKRRMAELEKEKFSALSKQEINHIKSLLPGGGEDEVVVKYKKRKAKAPNPLSLKKKKKIKVDLSTTAQEAVSTSTSITTTTTKRKRRKRSSKSSGPVSQ